jgi:hypothetical protein
MLDLRRLASDACEPGPVLGLAEMARDAGFAVNTVKTRVRAPTTRDLERLRGQAPCLSAHGLERERWAVRHQT